MISPYSIPAVVAFLAKLIIFYSSRRAVLQTTETRIFRLAILISLFLNVAEFMVLQKLSYGTTYASVIAYLSVSTLLVASVLHLALALSFDNWKSAQFLPVYVVVYGSALVLSLMFIFFTPLLIADIEDLRGYTVTVRPGPFYWLEETFLILGFLGMLILPLLGLRPDRAKNRRSQCKLWIAVASPLVLLVVTIVVLHHLNIRWFNVTVTSPLLLTLLLAGIGYSIHNPRIIELDFYIPWSKARKLKTRLYQNLNDLGHELRDGRSFQVLVDRIAGVLQCPVTLISNFNLALASTGSDRTILQFPVSQLAELERVTVINEIEVHRPVGELMSQYHLAAIIPLFPYSRSISFWLLCGEPFGQRVYSTLDYKVLQQLLERLAGLLLDRVMQFDPEVHAAEALLTQTDKQCRNLELQSKKNRRENSRLSLHARIAELEASCIKATLVQTKGNKAEAARLLGLRPNTLHYKLRRYGLD